MNIWIITTGSSDVQLKTNRWNTLHPKVRSQLETKKQFSLSESEQSGQKRWLVPSRAMGVVYSQALTENYNDLDFPLLNSFSAYLAKEKIELNRIIVLLTDQSDVVSVANKDKPSHPYWQDTCTLKPILLHRLKIAFPDVVMDSERDFPVLKPTSGSAGLDDWNEVLTLVQQEFVKLGVSENATVYVSHQAGTPAISSAVQFVSLASFKTNVKFLVTNEYSQQTGTISRSNYLGALQLQEAKALLDRHDYAGVKLLVNASLNSETQILLDAAIKWNLAKFDEFTKTLLQHPDGNFVEKINHRTQQENWWWTAYEEGYLAVVRLQQKNTVEAMFHSFRAVEGLIREWALWKYQLQIRASNLKQPRTHYFHNENINMSTELNYWFQKHHSKEYSNVGLFGEPLFELLKASHAPGIWHNNSDIKTVAKITKLERNSTFHQLRGLQESELFAAWDTDNQKDWEKRVLSCLNFISDKKFDKSIECPLEKTSLMSLVHEKLKKAIAPSEHTP
jgi:hypothetical protein